MFKEIIFLSVISFLAAHFLTSLCVKFFPKINLVDNPNDRKKHKLSTPTAGGVVISVIILFVIAMWFWAKEDSHILYLFFSVLTLAIISFIDDIVYLSILIRLPFQFLSAWLLLMHLDPVIIPQLEGLLPQSVLNIILLIGVVYFINIYNFMDGIDGSASSEAIHISISFILICFVTSLHAGFPLLLSFVLCFSCLGFLFHNWSPAKIFLGDVGSTTIGLICGWMMLVLGKAGFLAAALIIPGYYIADSTITLFKRMAKKEKFWEPHNQHFFQIALKSINCHSKVTRKIIKYNSMLCILSITSLLVPRTSLILAILLVSRLLIKMKKGK